MENLILCMSYGFFSFYLTGSFIGFTDTNLQSVALFGLALGCLREFTGKTLLELLFNK